MTYAFVVGHTLFTLSCSFVSICILMSYIYNFSLFLTLYVCTGILFRFVDRHLKSNLLSFESPSLFR